jgi:hypothetical protein
VEENKHLGMRMNVAPALLMKGNVEEEVGGI